MSKKKQASVGSSFESFLKEQGTLTDTTNRAIKRVIAYQLTQAMNEQSLTKAALAKRLHTSRSQLDRILDPENAGVTLEALASAAEAVGRELTIDLR